MAQAIDQPTKESFLKVSFNWDQTNTNQFKRYTDLPDPLPGGFVPEPRMSVKYPKNTASLEKKKCIIELPLDTFTTRLTDGKPHAPVKIVVQEVISPANPSDGSSLLTPFRGRLTRAKRNPAGRSGIVRLEALRPKSRLQIATGLPVMHHSPFDTYGPGSQLDRANFRDIRRIDLINGNIVTIDADPSETGTWFKNGHMEFEGLTIKIRDWDNDVDPTVFELIERPPDEWLSQFVNIYAGSNKTIEDVRDKLSNEINFGGIGFKIPPYNPQFEDTAGG